MSGRDDGVAARGPGARPAPDCDGLLAALVLDPSTYSRNRFFELYKDPEVRRARRRASTLRSVLRQLAATEGVEAVELAPRGDGGATLAYSVASLGLRRAVRLDSLELALVRFALGRAGKPSPAALGVDETATARVTSALERLAPR